MFTFRKVLFNRYCNMKALQLYFNWSGQPILSPVVLKLLRTDNLELEGLSVRLTGRV